MNAPAKITDFAKDLADSLEATDSHLVWEAIKQHFPSALQTHKCHEKNDRLGADILLEMEGGEVARIDLKTRKKDFSHGKRSDIDIALEITYGSKPGWAIKPSIADYFLFVCMDTGRSACFPASQLQRATIRNGDAWLDRCKSLVTRTAGHYGAISSQAVVVPSHIVAEAIRRLDMGA